MHPRADARHLTAEDQIMASRTLHFVTGMHRSGTSHLAGRLQASGLAFPGDMLPPNDDNPDGYWEAREVVVLNNQMLADVGLDWRSIAQLSRAQIEGLCDRFLSRVGACLDLLAEEAGDLDFAIKDPRLCRLMPIWQRAAQAQQFEPRLIASVREPDEIAASLFHRTRNASFRPAAVDVPQESILLCLRYMLDLERSSRRMIRRFIDYPQISNWTNTDDIAAAKAFDLRPLETRSWRDISSDVMRILQAGASPVCAIWLDEVADALDAALPRGVGPARIAGPSKAAARSADVYTRLPGRSTRSGLRVGFVSGAPESRGHIYRIENRISSLIGTDNAAIRIDPAAWSPAEVAGEVDAIVIFRKEMDSWLEQVFRHARAAGAVTIFDIDDLVVDESFMTPAYFRFLEGKTDAFVSEWRERARRYRLAAAAADVCWVTTEPLARHLSEVNPRVQVLRNGLSDASARVARRVRTILASRASSRVVLGYASGTPTHARDFEVLVEPLDKVMRLNPDVCLRITGALSDAALAPLAHFSDRIERRPIVDYWELPFELAGVDINLAPLETSNPFCECKSELKVFESAVLGIPTIASGTEPYRGAIVEAETGFAVSTADEWHDTLMRLSGDRRLREKLGANAKDFCERRFGYAQQRSDFLDCLTQAICLDAECSP
jgi:glycosyltransferase involved in cell wall biosynthesis